LENIPSIRIKLQTLLDVGLGYIHLGQSATTLSGGEAQRIKLAKELSRRATGRTLYILDEPTTGLHFHDVKKLLEVLNRLTDLGNTVIIIEHNVDVIKTADWVIDLGPEGGEEGGRIVTQGTPEQVARKTRSYTGQALAKVMPAGLLKVAEESPAYYP
jgi:excinuclease ABC subunit A